MLLKIVQCNMYYLYYNSCSVKRCLRETKITFCGGVFLVTRPLMNCIVVLRDTVEMFSYHRFNPGYLGSI